MPQFENFYGNEAEQYAYYTVPKPLFTDSNFKFLSTDSKLLYSFLLDRAGLSVKNDWIDDDGKVYVFFKLDELCERLNIGKDKAVKLFNELDSEKGGIGLIKRQKQGQGKPTKIYVMNFMKAYTNTNTNNSDFGKSEVKTSEKPKSENKAEVKTSENQKSKTLKNRSLEYGKSEVIPYSKPNRVNLIYQSYLINNQQGENKTEVRSLRNDNVIDEIDFDKEKSKIFQKIKGDNILQQKDKNGNMIYSSKQLDEIIDIIAWTNLAPISVLKINSINLDVDTVRRQFAKLEENHITYVLECLNESTSKISNRRNYLLTCLYNAPSSIDGYYKNLGNCKKQNNKDTSYDLAEFERFAENFSLFE